MINVLLFPVKLAAKIVLYALSLVFMLAALIMGIITALSGKPCTVVGVLAGAGVTIGVLLGGLELECIISSYMLCLGVILIPFIFALIMKGFMKATGGVRDLADSICLFQ